MSIYGMIYEELQAKIAHLPEYKKFKPAFDMLDREDIAGLELDGNTYWIEFSTYGHPSQKSIDLLKEYIATKGYKYLYN